MEILGRYHRDTPTDVGEYDGNFVLRGSSTSRVSCTSTSSYPGPQSLGGEQIFNTEEPPLSPLVLLLEGPLGPLRHYRVFAHWEILVQRSQPLIFFLTPFPRSEKDYKEEEQGKNREGGKILEDFPYEPWTKVRTPGLR